MPTSLTSAIAVIHPEFYDRYELPTVVWQQFKFPPNNSILTMPAKKRVGVGGGE